MAFSHSNYDKFIKAEYAIFNSVLASSASQKILGDKKSRVELTRSKILTNSKIKNIEILNKGLQVQDFNTKKTRLSNESTQQEKNKPILVRPELEHTWRKNAVQLSDLPSGPRIAIVIDDVGLNPNLTQSVIGLSAPLTLSFLTYGKSLPEQVNFAKKAGHEIMVHMAMEPLNKSIDPGPNALMINKSAGETLKKLRWGLERFDGYVGINNHMGSRFTSDPEGMEIVMRELKRRGLLFLDSRTSKRTVSASIALAHGVPFTERNIFLDNINSIPAINRQLRHLENFANKNGYGVAIAHPRETTIEALSQWLPIIAEKGFVQVPISTIAAEKQGLSAINLGDIKYKDPSE
jgi:hypothetical protein